MLALYSYHVTQTDLQLGFVLNFLVSNLLDFARGCGKNNKSKYKVKEKKAIETILYQELTVNETVAGFSGQLRMI